MRRGGVGGGLLMTQGSFRTGSALLLALQAGLATPTGSPTGRCRCRSKASSDHRFWDVLMEPVAPRQTQLALLHIERKLAAIEADIQQLRQFICYCTDDTTPIPLDQNDEL